MAQTGAKGVRAAFADATRRLVREQVLEDPPPDMPRVIDGVEYTAGKWPGAPFDKLPPGCPVVPLGVDGKVSYFIDTLGQLLDFEGMKEDGLIKLFRSTPNFLYHAWPRWSAPRGGGRPKINGVEVKKAIACLEKAAAGKGLFSPADRVRGRGAWADRSGRLIWHSGDALWRVDAGKLKAANTGELDGVFYPRRQAVMEPWPEPVDPSDTPAHVILDCLTTWSWERKQLDPVIVVGGMCAMLAGGALHWRPHLAAMGDKGVGKSELMALFKAVLDDALHDSGNTSAAGIYQRVALDTLPVAVDEFEASEDNRRAMAVLELVRISSSGARMFRGGQDHHGVEFQARNTYLCSGINLPPMKPQDKSRFAVLNLGKLTVGDKPPPVIRAEWGRMLLRALMDAWHDFPRALGDWRATLRASGLDGRAQDTYGTLFALAELVLGHERLSAFGLPIDDETRLGAMIADATAHERAEQRDNWRACLEHLLGKTIDAWKGGEKPTPGAVFEQLEESKIEFHAARERLAVAGLSVFEERPPEKSPAGTRAYVLAVPHASPALSELYRGTKWSDGGWWGALRQGIQAGVVRGDTKVVKINRASARCLIVDLRQYDQVMQGGT